MSPTFLENVDLLSTPTHTFVDTDEGKKLVTQIGLLTQLREAAIQGMESGGSSSAFGSRPPLDAGAHDTFEDIKRQIKEALAEVAIVPRVATAETLVRRWYAATDEHRMHNITEARMHSETEMRTGKHWKAAYQQPVQLAAWRLAQRWVDRIETFFNPPETREIQGPCPACEIEFIHRVKDGQEIQTRTLAFVRDKDGRATEARCAACGNRWTPDLFEWLAAAVGATKLPELDTPEGSAA